MPFIQDLTFVSFFVSEDFNLEGYKKKIISILFITLNSQLSTFIVVFRPAIFQGYNSLMYSS